MSAFAKRNREGLWIRGDKIDRRDGVQQLSRHERDDLFMVWRHPANAGHSAVPPLLVQEKGLVNHVERPLLPALAFEPVILPQRLDARQAIRIGGKSCKVGHNPDRLAHTRFCELLILSWRRQKMDRPIGIGEPKRGRRDSEGEAAHAGVQLPVDAGRTNLVPDHPQLVIVSPSRLANMADMRTWSLEAPAFRYRFVESHLSGHSTDPGCFTVVPVSKGSWPSPAEASAGGSVGF